MSASSNSFASTVDLRLRPSLGALRVIFAVHVAALGLLPLAMRPGWPLVVLVAAFGVSWFWLRHHPALGFGPRAITRLVWHADGGWSLFRGEREMRAELQPDSLVHPWLMVLNFRDPQGRRCARVIAGGETEAEPLRRLRARLKVGA
ncbi:protein YgfX [Solimonas variicoloris]|uniref:protein YgfX n=1 Tax=Solimonas variicoloris TaxID=254408 RepID=UPI0012B61968|nr:protein YgfX [Solimonas variicoloris]